MIDLASFLLPYYLAAALPGLLMLAAITLWIWPSKRERSFSFED